LETTLLTKRKLILYPFFIFLYPVLSLWAQNVQDVSPSEVYRALLISVLLGVLLWLIAWLFVRRWDKSALLASGAFLLIFSYGHFYNFLTQWNDNLAHHKFSLPIYVCLMLIWGWVVLKNDKHTELLNSMFKVIGPALLLLPVYTLGSTMIINANKDKHPAPQVAKIETSSQRPDIYYIILDGYGLEDTLGKYYGYDNSGFINYLKDTGFYVADQGRSNYISTVLSLSSSLNMQYVDTLLPEVDPHTKDPIHLAGYETDLLGFIHHSYVRSFLAEHGYRLVTYDNNFKTTTTDADVLLSYSSLSPRIGRNQKENDFIINSFEGLLLETSMARLWMDWQSALGMENIVIESPYLTHRALTVDMFESLKEISTMEGDNFVFMHFLVPHPPFVFGQNGEMSRHDQAFTLSDGINYSGTPRSYIRGYTEQLTYTNTHLEETLNYIINNSQPPPIIIIQGDHGPRMSLNFKNPKRTDLDGPFGNLNAYYFPDLDHTGLYPEITPVNSFRVLFNSYFGTEFELLPDANYLSTSTEPFNFVNVTELIK
jgi:hypothetical protein